MKTILEVLAVILIVALACLLFVGILLQQQECAAKGGVLARQLVGPVMQCVQELK